MAKRAPQDLPNRVRALRLARRLTLAELANKVGMATGHLSKIEIGDRELRHSWMKIIARELGVQVADLLNRDEGGLEPTERELVETVRDVPEIARKPFYSLMEDAQPYRGAPEVLPLRNGTKSA